MTSQEAENFINTELKGLWPDWTPTDAEVGLWLRELEKVDYFPTRTNINNWYISQSRIGRRPFLGQLRRLFKKILSEQELRAMSEPILLYKIIKESNITQRIYKDPKTGEDVEYASMLGQTFCVSRRDKLPADPQVIEQEAERKREQFNGIYGSNHIIVRSWNKFYENHTTFKETK